MVLFIYLLLTEFEGGTVNYGPSFAPSIYGHKQGAVIYSMSLENEVSKIFIISLNWTKSKPFKVKR